MSPVSLVLIVLWFVVGGLWMAAGWVIAAILMAITIIGLPWTRAAFNIAAYTLLPFGQKVVSRAVYFGREDICGQATRHRQGRTQTCKPRSRPLSLSA